MDLYRQALAFPQTLREDRPLFSWQRLQEYGISRHTLSWRAQHGRLLRPHRGAYLLGSGEANLLDAARAALLVSSPVAVLGFHTAAALFGFGVIDSVAVHVVVPAGAPFPQRPGIVVHRSVVPIGEPTTVMGVPCTSAARCAVDLARRLRRIDALPVLDAALGAAACTVDDLLAEVTRHGSCRGVRQVRELVELADPRPQCRQESQLRLILHDGNVRGFEPQVPVMDDEGVIRHYLDLADPGTRVGAEYDGASHLDRDRLRADRDRHNWLETRGWRMRYFTDKDLYSQPDRIIHTLNAARSTPPSRGSRAQSRGW